MFKQYYFAMVSCLILVNSNCCYANAVANIEAKSGSNVSGKINVQVQDDNLLITGKVQGLQANQSHAFHIHEFGDCSASDATSAGKHFNPSNKLHGHPQSVEHHIGDLPNLDADENGQAIVNFVLEGAYLDISDSGILDRAFVVHQQADDYRSQPAGNAGKRIACGVIQSE